MLALFFISCSMGFISREQSFVIKSDLFYLKFSDIDC
jgi:hypothetical protein